MNNQIPIDTTLRLILNNLLSCHVLGADALLYGQTVKMLDDLITVEAHNKVAPPKEEPENE